jgi:hypothetical protein
MHLLPTDHSPLPEIDCPELLTRVLRNRSNLDDDGNVTPEAFLLRAQDNGLLSVYRRSKVTVEDCKATFKKTFGAVSLHTGHIRDLNQTHPLGIDVIQSESPSDPCPGHSAVINLPDHSKPGERDFAEHLATLLRDQSRKIN